MSELEKYFNIKLVTVCKDSKITLEELPIAELNKLYTIIQYDGKYYLSINSVLVLDADLLLKEEVVKLLVEDNVHKPTRQKEPENPTPPQIVAYFETMFDLIEQAMNGDGGNGGNGGDDIFYFERGDDTE